MPQWQLGAVDNDKVLGFRDVWGLGIRGSCGLGLRAYGDYVRLWAAHASKRDVSCGVRLDSRSLPTEPPSSRLWLAVVFNTYPVPPSCCMNGVSMCSSCCDSWEPVRLNLKLPKLLGSRFAIPAEPGLSASTLNSKKSQTSASAWPGRNEKKDKN